MKTINSPVKRIEIGRFGGSPKAIALGKVISRKVERARLKSWLGKTMVLEHLDALAEKRENQILAAEQQYMELMERIQRQQRQKRKQLQSAREEHKRTAMVWLPNYEERSDFIVGTEPHSMRRLASVAV